MESETIRNEFVIHWNEIFRNILIRWWIILIAAIVGCGFGFMLGTIMYTPSYESEAVYLVSYNGDSDSVGQVSSENTLVSNLLVNCVSIVQQNKFFNILLEQDELKELNSGKGEEDKDYISADSLKEYIIYNYPTGSASKSTIITITVSTDDAEKSLKIVEAMTKKVANTDESFFANYIKENYTISVANDLEFSLINEPEMAKNPSDEFQRTTFAIVGGVAFAILSIGIMFLIFISDSRIKSDEDLSTKYNVPVLGTIPNFEKSEQNVGRILE